jgi:hypothetical protein
LSVRLAPLRSLLPTEFTPFTLSTPKFVQPLPTEEASCQNLNQSPPLPPLLRAHMRTNPAPWTRAQPLLSPTPLTDQDTDNLHRDPSQILSADASLETRQYPSLFRVISRFSVWANPDRPASRRCASAVLERGGPGGVLLPVLFSPSAAVPPAKTPQPQLWPQTSKWRFRRFRRNLSPEGVPRGGGPGVGSGGSQGRREPCGVLCRFSLGGCGEAPANLPARPARFSQHAVRKTAASVLI